MCRECQPFDLGEIFVTTSVTRLLMGDTVACALSCHSRFALHAHRLGNEADDPVRPRLIRSTHVCCDDQSNRHVPFDILTLQLGDCVRTIVHLSDHDEDYGSVPIVHALPEPDGENAALTH